MNTTLAVPVCTAFRKDANGIYYVTLTSSGRIGEEWEVRLKESGKTLGPVVKSLLYSNYFDSFGGEGRKKVDLAILPGHLWQDDKRTWDDGIIRTAHNHGLTRKELTMDMACLLADCLPTLDVVTDTGNIIVLHSPYGHKDAGPVVLGANMQDGGLHTFRAGGKTIFDVTDYFAFVRWIRDSEDEDIKW